MDGIGDKLLDELVGEQTPPSTSPTFPAVLSPTAQARLEGGAIPPQKMRYSHQALIDLMITRPELSQNEFAAILGYTPSWLSTIICSDTFQMALAERREEIVDPQVRATLQEQFKGILGRSMEIIRRKLDGSPENIEGQFALRCAEVSSRALGYGARPIEAPKTGDIHFHLESLGDNLVQVLRTKKREILEGELVDGPQRST